MKTGEGLREGWGVGLHDSPWTPISGVGEMPSLLNQIPPSEAASLHSPLARTWSAQRTFLRFTVLFQFISLSRWIRDWPHLPLEGPHLGAQTPVCEGCSIPGSGDPPTPIGHLLPGERPTKDSGLCYNGPMGTSARGSDQTGNSRCKGTPSTLPASHNIREQNLEAEKSSQWGGGFSFIDRDSQLHS